MKYVIVGNGPAGFTAAMAIRRLDPGGTVTVVSDEPYPFYSRVLTTHLLAGHIPRGQLFLADEATYRSWGIGLLSGHRVVAAADGLLQLDDGTGLPYDRLLLATGAAPVPLDVPGADLPGVHYLRTLDDAEGILSQVEPGATAVVIGGGMVGFKATEGLLGRGMKVVMVVSSPYVLSQALDEEGGRLVERLLEEEGVDVRTRREVVEFNASPGGLEVTLRTVTSGGSEETVPCRLAIVGKGVRPNLHLAGALGLRTDRGILCDQQMATSHPGIFAAGDVAQVFDPASGEARVNAIWPHAVAQGRVAGSNMVRPGSAGFWGGIGQNALSLGRLSVISGGLVAPKGDGYQEIRVRGPGWYRKLVLKDGRAVGAAFVGDTSGAGVVLSYVRSGKRVFSGHKDNALVDAFATGRLHAGRLLFSWCT
ncbi:MAG TPA: NAD(P)/FAD-dependent oxidoreductase [Firmicutes bacterium]|nr:NAD(P)/FAD-dependent oxidoreductase [Bacillota bacterium]